MSNVFVDKNKIDLLANAISAKSGEPLTLTLDEMVEAVDGIDVGGGGSAEPNLQSKTYTVDSAGTETITADVGYDGLSDVEVSVPSADYEAHTDNYYTTVSGQRLWHNEALLQIIDGGGGWITEGGYSVLRTNYNAIPTGTTVTPTTSEQTIGGTDYMMEGAVTVSAIPTGTAGTPTATKGTVSNHAISVTPSVTNTAGYISGGTKTGTAVTVSASELVSGDKSITANGNNIDVANYSTVSVNVSGGGSSVKIRTSTAGAMDAGTLRFYITEEVDPTSFVVTSLNDIATSSPATISTVVYDGTNLFNQSISTTSNANVSYANSGISKSYSDGYLTLTSSTNYFSTEATYKIVYSYDGSSANINTTDIQVGSGATSITFTNLEDEPIYWSCAFKSNFNTSSGYQRVITVAYDGTNIYGLEMDSSAKYSASHWTSSYNNGSLTITSQGTNAGGYFHQPGYYQLTYAIDASGNYQTKTVTPTTSQQIVTADSGYDALKKVTVNAMPTMTLPSATSATSSGTSKSTITPSSSVQYLNIPTGYNETAQYYTISASGGGTSKNVQVLQSTSRTNSSSLTKVLGDLTVSKTGTYDIYWSGGRSNTSTSYTWGTRLYVDGSGYGTENTSWSNNCQSNHLSNVSLTANQKLSVYARGRSGSYYTFVPLLVIMES